MGSYENVVVCPSVWFSTVRRINQSGFFWFWEYAREKSILRMSRVKVFLKILICLVLIKISPIMFFFFRKFYYYYLLEMNQNGRSYGIPIFYTVRPLCRLIFMAVTTLGNEEISALKIKNKNFYWTNHKVARLVVISNHSKTTQNCYDSHSNISNNQVWVVLLILHPKVMFQKSKH